MSSHLQTTLHSSARLTLHYLSFTVGSIISFSLPYPFVDFIPGVEATPSVASSTVSASSSPNRRPPHSCLVAGVEATAGDDKVTGYLMGTMNDGNFLHKIVEKSPTSSLLTSWGLRVTIPNQDLFIPLHYPSTPGLQPAASDSGPAFFPDPPLAPVYILDVPCWLNLSETTVSLTGNHNVCSSFSSSSCYLPFVNQTPRSCNCSMPTASPCKSLCLLYTKLIEISITEDEAVKRGKFAAIVVEADSDSDSDSDYDWDDQDLHRIMNEEEMYWTIALIAQLSPRSNFYTQALESLNIQRAQKAKAKLDARAERVTQWLSHLAEENDD